MGAKEATVKGTVCKGWLQHGPRCVEFVSPCPHLSVLTREYSLSSCSLQEAPDLGGSSAGLHTPVLPRILSAPSILAVEPRSHMVRQSMAMDVPDSSGLGASGETEQASAAAPGDAGLTASSALSLHGWVWRSS